MIVKLNKELEKTIEKTHKAEKEIMISEDFGKKPFNYTVAEVLINHVISNQSNPVITYKQLALKISPDFSPRNLGNYLGYISDECKENGLPLISSIVVNQESGLPGEGFYNYYYGEKPMSEWKNIFEECKLNVINCTLWNNLLEAIMATK